MINQASLDVFCRDMSYKEMGESLKSEARRRVFRALSKAPMTSQEIADYLGVRRAGVTGRLRELMGGSRRDLPVLVEIVKHKLDTDTERLVSVYGIRREDYV